MGYQIALFGKPSLKSCLPAWVCCLVFGMVSLWPVLAPRAEGIGHSPYYTVSSLEKEWMIYDRKVGEYVPFLAKIHFDKRQIHLLADPDSLPAKYVSILGAKGAYLFINRRLVQTWPSETWLHLNLDSLNRHYHVKGHNALLLTYYLADSPIRSSPPVFCTNRQDSIQAPAPIVAGTLVSPPDQEQRLADPRKSFLGLLTLLILAAVAIFSQINGPLFSIQYFGNALAVLFGKERELAKRLELGTFVLFMIYYGISIAFIALFADTYTTLIRLPETSFPTVTLWDWLGSFLLIALGMSLAVTAKYWLLLIFANLYNDRNLATAHIYEFMNLSRFFCTFFVLLTLLLNASPTAQIHRFAPLLFGAFAIGLLAKSILVCYRVNKLSPHRSFYLFAYLCSVELIPVLASLKIFVTI